MLNVLINADCLVAMKDIPDKSVDMVLCDLPYGMTSNKWDSIVPLEPLWKEYERIVTDRAAIVLFSQQPFAAALIDSKPDLFRYELIWIKSSSGGFLNSHFAPLKIHENILVFGKSTTSSTGNKTVSMTYHPQMIKGGKPYRAVSGRTSTNYGKNKPQVETVSNGERYPYDVIQCSNEFRKVHPTQKPVELLRYLIRTYTDVGGG